MEAQANNPFHRGNVMPFCKSVKKSRFKSATTFNGALQLWKDASNKKEVELLR